MTMSEIRMIARERGIRSGNMKKGELIKAIQSAEGNCACFGDMARGPCDQTACLWRTECQV